MPLKYLFINKIRQSYRVPSKTKQKNWQTIISGINFRAGNLYRVPAKSPVLLV